MRDRSHVGNHEGNRIKTNFPLDMKKAQIQATLSTLLCADPTKLCIPPALRAFRRRSSIPRWPCSTCLAATPARGSSSAAAPSAFDRAPFPLAADFNSSVSCSTRASRSMTWEDGAINSAMRSNASQGKKSPSYVHQGHGMRRDAARRRIKRGE